MSRIADKIEMVRLRRDITQAELESLAGLPPNRVSKWVGGSGEPTLRQGRRIAAALGVDLDWLADDQAPDDEWDVVRGLTKIQGHNVYLCGQVGDEEAARLLTRALMEGRAAARGDEGATPRPVVRDLTAERERDARKGARRRRPKGRDGGGEPGGGMGGPPDAGGRVALRATPED